MTLPPDDDDADNVYDYRKYRRDGVLKDPKALKFTRFDEIDIDVKKDWLIKNVAARGETTGLSGPPGSGKSCLAIDIAVHMALCRDWRGYKAKERCAVLILTFERFDLTVRRLEAYRRKHGLKGLPIAIARADTINILDPGCVAILEATIDEAGYTLGCKVGEVIIDTFPKALAAANGDENSAKDQNRSRAHLNTARDNTNVHLTLVGHTGKDPGKGTRGSNAAPGDVDVEIIIAGDLVKTVTVEKANDQKTGLLTSYRIESYVFGTDEDGDVIDTAILADDEPPKPEVVRRKRPTAKQARALAALDDILVGETARPPDPLWGLPKAVARVVTVDEWRQACMDRNIMEGASNPWSSFGALVNALASPAHGCVGILHNHVWRVM